MLHGFSSFVPVSTFTLFDVWLHPEVHVAALSALLSLFFIL
jgi:hypothetical protein